MLASPGPEEGSQTSALCECDDGGQTQGPRQNLVKLLNFERFASGGFPLDPL